MKKLLLLILVLSACTSESQKPHEVGAVGASGMVASAHPLATKVGVEILKNGGNAFDAAVGVQFALAVVYPHAGNIAGGGFAVFRQADGTRGSLDFREKAPLAASRDMYLDATGNVIPDRSTLGHKAVGVPGSVAGMWELHQAFGKMPWAELIDPAIQLAHFGHVLTERAAVTLNDNQEGLKKANTYTPWMVREAKWAAGDSIMQRELAATLSFIRNEGRNGFYQGIVADQLIKEMIRGKGYVTQADLDQYAPVWREPLVFDYKGHTIISMPPPSSGGIALGQLLYGAETLGLADYTHNSPEYINLMAEIEKRVYADRSEYLGDPDFFTVPVQTLLSSAYLDGRFEGISARTRTPSSEIKFGEITMTESTETTHFSIVDKEGNAIAITTTLNGSMGSKVMVKGAGFLLNNEMDDFSIKPGEPNMFGLVGNKGNAIAPGKRMLSSMTPTLVEKDGELKMLLGAPGGATIITSVFQAILNVIDHGMSMQAAVNATRVHHQWLPDVLQIEEGRLPDQTIKRLKRMGHQFKLSETIGRMDCILILNDSTLEGASDYTRGDNYAEGY